MSDTSLKEKTAKGLFWGGFSNGIQQLLNLGFGIVLARLLDASDYGMDQETAYRTMACFAAGMYTGSVCGCVTAALAVLGLAYGFSDTKDREREIFGTKIAEEFVDRFQERMEGKFNCADILENNISTAEGMASIRREGMIKKKCTQAIQTSIEILEDMLQAYPGMLAGHGIQIDLSGTPAAGDKILLQPTKRAAWYLWSARCGCHPCPPRTPRNRWRC
jgi:C_GCAxxG_C_C family probable redox protein